MSHLKHGMEEKSRDIVSGFMALFGRDGRIVSHTRGNDDTLPTLCVCVCARVSFSLGRRSGLRKFSLQTLMDQDPVLMKQTTLWEVRVH